MEEVWKIPASLPAYEVSNLGNVRRRGRRNRILKICKRGYAWFGVSDGKGSSRNVSVARLVCEAFNGASPIRDADCDHINRIRSDNRPANLRWLTRADNLSNRQLAFGEQHAAAKLNASMVRHIRSFPFRRGQDRQLAAELGVSRETVRDVRLNKLWRHVDA